MYAWQVVGWLVHVHYMLLPYMVLNIAGYWLIRQTVGCICKVVLELGKWMRAFS